MKNKKLKSILKALKHNWWQLDEVNTINLRIVKNFTEFCMHLPKSVRKIALSIGALIGILFSRFFFLISRFYLNIFLIQGYEKHSGKKLNILFLNKENEFSYLHDRLYDKFSSKIIGKCFFLNIEKKLNNISFDYDAIFIKSDVFFSRFFEKLGYIVIPEYVSMTLDISKPLEKIFHKFKKSAKEDVRKIKKVGYTFEISKNLDKLRMFYDKMYLPYICDRCGKLSKCGDYNFMRYLIEKNSKLLLIKLNGEYVYGGLFSCAKNKVIASFSGMMDGKLKYLRQGLGAAPYYFLILWAKENGFNLLNFGKSKPFLNDGLLRYKRKWGMSIKKAESYYSGIFSFKLINNSESIQSFLTNNPLITLENNYLKGIFFLHEKHRVTSEDLQHLIKIYNIPNLKEFNFKSAKDNSLILSVK